MENHCINVENKNRLTITEVTGVDAFDEETILVTLKDWSIVVSGSGLHIEELDLETGNLLATGNVENIGYTKKREKVSLWKRFRK